MPWLKLTASAGVILFSLIVLTGSAMGAERSKVLQAGAAAIDITPQEFPVRVSGSFFEQTTDQVTDRLHARSLVLDNGQERIALVVIDNCVMSRDLLDEAKQLANNATGIPVDRMLMSATHTHSGPALDGLLGADGNMSYRKRLPAKIAEAVKAAVANLAPARIGWTVVQDFDNTHCRQWIRRPDRMDVDPFGYRSVRSMMHPGYQNPDYLGPAGPSDPDISIISVQSLERKPVALLANYSMHYFGAKPLSADYFGAFAVKIAELIGAGDTRPPFVGIMSNGTSGDQHWMDYSRPKPAHSNHVEYAEVIAREVFDACGKIEYRDWVPLTMREKTLTLTNRPISEENLAKARQVVATFTGRKPKTLPELYAWEQVEMSRKPSTHELKLQALSIGDLGIAAIPCEVFGITGLKIKACSPMPRMLTLELANGYNGYIPPPDQHPLGGYTTWRAMSACLEVEAEPKIVDAVLGLLEEITGKPRRVPTTEDYPFGDYPRAVLASKPLAYWRLNEFNGPQASDGSGNDNPGTFEPGVAFYLEGPAAPAAGEGKRINRAPQCAGGRITAQIKGLDDKYAVEMWFSNYLPIDARDVTGYLFSRGPDGVQGAPGDHLGLGGKSAAPGKLLFHTGDRLKEGLLGRTDIKTKTWNHVAMVREGRKVIVYLNGGPAAEVSGEAGTSVPAGTDRLFIGGRNDGFAGFEGRIDEVAVYNRPLSMDEVAGHYRAAMGAKLASR
jgi:hypothetical protein